MLKENNANNIKPANLLTRPEYEFIEEQIGEFEKMNLIYRSAIKEINTKLEILNDELQLRSKRNPIAYVKTRIKKPKSILGKLERKGLSVSVQSAMENLNDIAGIRIICSFVSDIYTVAQMIAKQNDIKVISTKDYIENPKPNGYRSLHIVVQVPVFFSDHIRYINAEIQIRTIAMDFWANLEHQLHYKVASEVPEGITDELKLCADVIADTDMRMQKIHNIVHRID